MSTNYEAGAYSFQDCSLAIVGPNINTTVTGTSEEGYEVEFEGDKSSVVIGAGGDGMTSVRADTITCQGVSFRKLPGLRFAEMGGNNVWTFNCIRITPSLGAGVDVTLNG